MMISRINSTNDAALDPLGCPLLSMHDAPRILLYICFAFPGVGAKLSFVRMRGLICLSTSLRSGRRTHPAELSPWAGTHTHRFSHQPPPLLLPPQWSLLQ